MPLIDEATIKVFGGAGGDGCVSFRREKYVPYGGPNGGNGGDGGSVYLESTHDRSSLLDFRYQPKYQGERGEHGQGSDCFGRCGKDVVIQIAVGTVVFDAETGETLFDLNEPGMKVCLAKGGRGGRGNASFKTQRNTAPQISEKGEPGEEFLLDLELKLLADVGLIGCPNAGKSTLLSRLTAARPKIANYPFTTLIPNLGVVSLPLGSRVSDRSFVLADVPGLIEGAHRGLGLGHRFLRHLQRTRVLIHLLEVTDQPDRQPLRDFFVLNEELRRFDPALAARPQLVALTKMDLPDTRAAFPAAKEALSALGQTLWPISAATGEGVADLMTEAYRLAKAVPAEDPHPMMAEAMSGQK